MATFAKVVDLNGFTAAAKALKVPKAAVSRAIADLERELGVKVLTRTTRRIHLTPAGEQLLPHCRTILEAAEQARQRAAELTQPRGGPLKVLAEATYGRVLLSPLVPRFLERFPAGASADPERISGVLGAPPSVLVATPGYLQRFPLPLRPE